MTRMQVRSIARSAKLPLTFVLIASMPLQDAVASGNSGNSLESYVVAQTSLGGPERVQSPPPATPPPAPPLAAPSSPPTDYTPPNQGESKPQQNQSTQVWWGAIAFTADGSWSSTWKMSSQPEAEAKVLRQCAAFGHGGCDVVSFSGSECVGLATFIGSHRRRRWLLSFTAGGLTYPEAQGAAVGRCNSDERSQGRCQLRTAACADGR